MEHKYYLIYSSYAEKRQPSSEVAMNRHKIFTGWLIDGTNRDILYSRRASQRNILQLGLSINYPVISKSHLSKEEIDLFNEHRVEEIVRLRRMKKHEKEIELQNRLKQVQEIADYYSIHGFEKTQQKFGSISKGLTSLAGMLGMFRHYKKYGLKFEARNNIVGQTNGSWFI